MLIASALKANVPLAQGTISSGESRHSGPQQIPTPHQTLILDNPLGLDVLGHN